MTQYLLNLKKKNLQAKLMKHLNMMNVIFQIYPYMKEFFMKQFKREGIVTSTILGLLHYGNTKLFQINQTNTDERRY